MVVIKVTDPVQCNNLLAEVVKSERRTQSRGQEPVTKASLAPLTTGSFSISSHEVMISLMAFLSEKQGM